jgi:hypothetical protein
MEVLQWMTLWSHIFFGLLALVAGSIALGSHKGGRCHRRAGKVFYYSMLAVPDTALALALPGENWFLTSIALFAGYQAWSGNRSVVHKSCRPEMIDWVVTVLALLTAGWMLAMKVVVLWVFGGIMAFLALGDVALFVRLQRGGSIRPTQWLIRHIGMMSGAYIATFTAFLVVNVHSFQPGWVLWLAPTMVGMPLIAYWTRRATKGVRTATVAVCLSMATAVAEAQEIQDTFYTPAYLDRSTRFAWTTFGGDVHMLAGGHIQIPHGDKVQFGPAFQPRLTMGGIHFWGYADFYVTFPLPAAVDLSVSPFEQLRFREGVETGARIYPIPIRPGAWRPFAGISFKPLTYGHASSQIVH